MGLTVKQRGLRGDPTSFIESLIDEYVSSGNAIPPTSKRWKPNKDKKKDKQHQVNFRKWLWEKKQIKVNGCSCSPDWGVNLYSLCDGHDVLYHIGGSLDQKKVDDKWFYFSIIDRMKYYKARWHFMFYWVAITRWTAVRSFGRWFKFGRYYNAKK